MTWVVKAKALAIMVTVLVAGAAGKPAAAPMICGEREAVVAELQGRYGETRRSIGLQEGRGIVEVYASDKTGSWTILLTNAAGRTCLLAAGEAFEAEAVAMLDVPA